MQPKEPERRTTRGGTAAHPRPPREPDSAHKVTSAIALAVTFVFLVVTAAGLGWFLSGDGPLSSSSNRDGETASGGESAAQEDPGTGGAPLSGEAVVEDPSAGLSYRLPGEGWRRLGDDEVPLEYSSYAVYGSPSDPDAFIVTGSRELLPMEPLSVAGARLALGALGDLVSDAGSLRLGPSGPTEVDGSPAFDASVENGETGAYGRFLLVETGDRKGAFMLGLDTGGGEAASSAIDEAFDTLGVL